MSGHDNGFDRTCEETSLYSMIRNYQHDQRRPADRQSSRDQSTSAYRIEDFNRSSMMSKYAKSCPDVQKQSNLRRDQGRADSDPRRRHSGIDQSDQRQTGLNQKQTSLDSIPSSISYRDTKPLRLELLRQKQASLDSKPKHNRSQGLAIDFNDDSKPGIYHRHSSLDQIDHGQSGINQKQSNMVSNQAVKRSSLKSKDNKRFGMIQPDCRERSENQKQSSPAQDSGRPGKDQGNQRQSSTRGSSSNAKHEYKRSSPQSQDHKRLSLVQTGHKQPSVDKSQHQHHTSSNSRDHWRTGKDQRQSSLDSKHDQRRSSSDARRSQQDQQQVARDRTSEPTVAGSQHHQNRSNDASPPEKRTVGLHSASASQRQEKSSPESTMDKTKSSPTQQRYKSDVSDQSKSGEYVEKLSLAFQAQLLKEELTDEGENKRALREDMRREGSVRKQNKRYAVIIDDVLDVPLDLPGPICRDSLDYAHQRRYHNLLQEHRTMKQQQASSKVANRQMTKPNTTKVHSKDGPVTNGSRAPPEVHSITTNKYGVTKDNISGTVDTESTPSVRKQRELFELKMEKGANRDEQHKPVSKAAHKSGLLGRQYKRDADDQGLPANKYNKTDSTDNDMVSRNVRKPIWPPPQPIPPSDHSDSESGIFVDDEDDLLLSGTLKHHDVKKIPFTDERFHMFQQSSRAKVIAAASRREDEKTQDVQTATIPMPEDQSRAREMTAPAPNSKDDSDQEKATATELKHESGTRGRNETAAPPNPEHDDNGAGKVAAVPNISQDKCQICWATMIGSPEVKTLQCSHQFHTFCINEWFQEVSTCPTCRTNCKQEAGLVPKNKMADCQICWSDFEARQPVKYLPCRHHFHYHCIIPWLKEISRCPTCRRECKPVETRITTDCAFCHRDLTQDVQTLPCSHKYHAPCITRWFRDKTSCPTCQMDCTKYRRQMRQEEERIQLEEDAALARQLHEEEEEEYRLKKVEPEESEMRKVCQICKFECVAADDVKFLPCIHSFHRTCIDRWLKEVKKCPICRTDCSNVR